MPCFSFKMTGLSPTVQSTSVGRQPLCLFRDISPIRGITRHQFHGKARLYGLAFFISKKAMTLSLLFLYPKNFFDNFWEP